MAEGAVSMKFRTEDELRAYFQEGGDLLDRENRVAYIADTNGEGVLFGIMVAEGIPKESCDLVFDAVEFALDNFPAPGAFGAQDRMWFMGVPGGWFSELAEMVIAEPNRFATE